MLVSWGVLAAGKTSVIALIVGIAVLDLGVQGVHISNQSTIYALRPEARSRLTTGLMVGYFLGGAVLSAVTSTPVRPATAGAASACSARRHRAAARRSLVWRASSRGWPRAADRGRDPRRQAVV